MEKRFIIRCQNCGSEIPNDWANQARAEAQVQGFDEVRFRLFCPQYDPDTDLCSNLTEREEPYWELR